MCRSQESYMLFQLFPKHDVVRLETDKNIIRTYTVKQWNKVDRQLYIHVLKPEFITPVALW